MDKVELQSRSVQELVINGEQLPENYIYPDGDYEVIDDSLPTVDIPVIDLSLLSSSSEELNKLRSALSSWGCFQAINHGMTSSFLDKVRQLTKQFFALPIKEKQKYARPVDAMEGYGNDMVLSEKQTLDWTDRLYLTVCPEDRRKLEFWPRDPKTFREILHEYTMNSNHIAELLLKAMAMSLNIEENCFLDQCGEQALMYARFNFYPPCPRPKNVLGLKPHADGSSITILLQDKEVEGLQVLKDDHWFRVPILPHALLINIGDQVEMMSNGIFHSPVHRVVTNSERERISMAMFCIPEPQREIGPADGLISEIRPRLYKNVKNFVDLYFQNYQQGKRLIDTLRL